MKEARSVTLQSKIVLAMKQIFLQLNLTIKIAKVFDKIEGFHAAG